MTRSKIIIFLIITLFNFSTFSFPIPESDIVEFDIIRKNKVIGSHKIEFIINDDILLVKTNINIKVKALFIEVYKFAHQATETWLDGNFIKIDAHTDFEDEREYFIKGRDDGDLFIASGMDGKLELNKNILPSNFWNINILKQKEIFDTQNGIVRIIKVKDLGYETIKINSDNIKCKKFTLNASSNPKDKGPFPEYTLWYDEKEELMKFKFLNWKDDKIISLIRKQ